MIPANKLEECVPAVIDARTEKVVMRIKKHKIYMEDILGLWANYVDWDWFRKYGITIKKIDSNNLFHQMTVTLELPMINFTEKDKNKNDY